jgi:hypothetical protein
MPYGVKPTRWVDTDVSIDFEGKLVLCEGCVGEMAQLIGRVPEERLAQMRAKIANLRQEVGNLRSQVSAAKAALAAFGTEQTARKVAAK